MYISTVNSSSVFIKNHHVVAGVSLMGVFFILFCFVFLRNFASVLVNQNLFVFIIGQTILSLGLKRFIFHYHCYDTVVVF